MMKIIKLTLLVLGLSFIIGVSAAQRYCDPNRIELKGDSSITTNQVSEYTINDTWGLKDSSELNSYYSLWKDDQRLESVQGDKFFFNFESEGEYLLKASLTLDNCKYDLEKKLDVFYKSVFYIGYDLEEFGIGYENNFKSNAILFNKVLVSNSVFSEDEIVNKLLEKQNILKNSDIIIVNNKETDTVFQILGKLSKSENIDFSKQEIFVINNTNKHLMKRILSKYIMLIKNENIYMINNDHLLNLISEISFGKNIVNESLIELFPLSYQKTSNRLVLSYIIDTLIANGLPINLIGLFLTLSVAALIITIFRQVVGFSVFGTFSPLLFGLSISVLGTHATIIFFLIAFIATVLARLITKKFYLLHSAKISLLIIIYFLTIILFLGLDKILGINMVDLQIFNNVFAVFPIMFLILVTDKVFHEGFKMFSKGWLISLVEFLIVSILVYFTISSIWIRSVLLSYPEIIILVGFLIMLVGRFTGLQVLEYFRFMPILKGEGNEEE
ncbi:MAG TPA: 7TM domain-containing protein [Candidatus Absconditabacterales bacterium]|nr:7TM domain-containing protein [Candidatus Absconditabacterales bacterium]